MSIKNQYTEIKIGSYLNSIRLHIALLCPLALPYRVLRPMSKGMYLYLIICLKGGVKKAGRMKSGDGREREEIKDRLTESASA